MSKRPAPYEKHRRGSTPVISRDQFKWIAQAADEELFDVAAHEEKLLALACRSELIRRATQVIDDEINERKQFVKEMTP